MVPNIKLLKRLFGVIMYLKITYPDDPKYRIDEGRSVEAMEVTF